MQDTDILTVEAEYTHVAGKCIDDLRRYMGRGDKMFDGDAQEYIRELRDCDRN